MQTENVMNLVEDTNCTIDLAKQIDYIGRVLNRKYGVGTIAYIDMKSWAFNGISEVCMNEFNKIKDAVEAENRRIMNKRHAEATAFCLKLLNALDNRVYGK